MACHWATATPDAPDVSKQDGIKASGEHSLNVVDTPAGRLGVLIGSDSWYPDNYRKLDEQRATGRGARLCQGAAPGISRGEDTGARRRHPVSLKPGELSEGRPGSA
jgi:hypothetical protein